MIGKSLCFAAILAVVFAVSSSLAPGEFERFGARKNESHNLIVGSRVYGDRLVRRVSVYKPSSWLQVVTQEQIFNVTSYYDRITQVRALDTKTDGTGANATLLAGGPGMSYVKLRFKSQRSHGIKFIVELYAKRY